MNELEGEMGLPFEPEMVRVPGGEFLMGAKAAREPFDRLRTLAQPFDGEDESVERAYGGGWHVPQHRLYVAEFCIGRTPVTHGQYAAFLQETDHPLPKRWRSRTCPRGREELPIVRVSWHDARAYCGWLSQVSGKPYRLPSEAEWEKGGSWELVDWEIGNREIGGLGGRKRRYPWGNRWGKKHCNSLEGEVGKVTPVEAYPSGASPYGLLDMAGNVWEWTLSLWGEDWYAPAFGYPYDAGDGREDLEAEDRVARVLRGGSFAYDARFARCAYRYKGFPQNYSDGIGFRVAYSPEALT